MGRKETPAERRERIAKRTARIAERDRNRLILGRPSRIIEIEPSRDELAIYDREGNSTTAIRDLWKHNAAFLVCGGPSLRTLDLSLIDNPLICSMGVNNVAAYAPVKAMVHSDPVSKFHGSIYMNPSIMKFTPLPKMKEQVRFKDESGFYFGPLRAKDYPNMWGFDRESYLFPESFLTTKIAYWGVNPDKWSSMEGRRGVLFTPFLGLRILYYLGVRVIYLLGVDFDMKPGNDGYAFGQKRTQQNASTNNLQYRIVNDLMVELRPHFESHGLQVFNCNPKSRLSAFDHVDYEAAVNSCLSAHPQQPLDLDHWYEKGDELRAALERDRHDSVGVEKKVLG